jgi:ribokinase
MKVTVIGSLNTDMVTRTPRVPEAGETLQASSFEVGWGGKGGNQAVAAAKLGWSDQIMVSMIGAVGDDVFGPQLLKSMEDDGVNIKGVRIINGQNTGTAVILVEEDSGENRILVTPGANHALKVEDELVKDNEYGDVAIFQLEIPLDVVRLSNHAPKYLFDYLPGNSPYQKCPSQWSSSRFQPSSSSDVTGFALPRYYPSHN